ncbi:MAG TPA: glycyl-radical enzyme activating protein [Bacteroidales bacterium]|nr:glycyl-radical enzyme activating protein [Bacteroidales bacterium]HPT03171.1 glycyl-radical enzyme activating protein [Bacteroidales bacterium]
MKGLIFDIKRYCVHDGPGIRTTVFLKGCPLNCLWCHNPESRLHEIQYVHRKRNIGNQEFEEEEIIGRWYTVAEVMKELEKDSLFYDESGGGITLSGGEPLMQAGFTGELASACRQRGWHVALDTCGYASRSSFEKVVPYINLYLYDLKGMNNADHLIHTGVENSLILDNLISLLDGGGKVIFRYPVIPGMNDSENHLLDLMHFLMNLRSTQREIHLLPYHTIQKSKYERLGLTYRLSELPAATDESLREMKAGLESIGYTVRIGG